MKKAYAQLVETSAEQAQIMKNINNTLEKKKQEKGKKKQKAQKEQVEEEEEVQEAVEERLTDEQEADRRNIILKIADIQSLLPNEKKLEILKKIDLQTLDYENIKKVWEKVTTIIFYNHPRIWHLKGAHIMTEKMETIFSAIPELKAPGFHDALKSDPEFSLQVQLWSLVNFDYKKSSPIWNILSIAAEKYMECKAGALIDEKRRQSFYSQPVPDSIFSKFQKL
jgi:hypothetical protein